MNKKVITSTAAVTVAALLASCTQAQLQQAGRAVAGVGLGVAAGSLLSGNSRDAGRILAAVALTVVAVSIIQQYQASQAQARYAQARAVRVSRSKTYAKAKTEKRVRYVAVPVKKKSTTEKSGLMIYDTEKGQLASNKVYVPKASSIKGNSIVTVDGKKALLESGFDGS